MPEEAPGGGRGDCDSRDLEEPRRLMVATDSQTSASPALRRSWRHDLGSPGGVILTAVVIACCAAVMVNWGVGLGGDLLLGAAVAGVLFRIPAIVAASAALTLLAITAVTLALNGQVLSYSFADLAYYCLAVASLWALWDVILERLAWRMPGAMLHGHLVQANGYRYLAVLGIAVFALAFAAEVSFLNGIAGVVLIVLTVVGVLRGLGASAALWCGCTLFILTIAYGVSGNIMTWAVSTGALACGAFVAALLWFCWRTVVPASFEWRTLRRLLRPVPGSPRGRDTSGRSSSKDRSSGNA